MNGPVSINVQLPPGKMIIAGNVTLVNHDGELLLGVGKDFVMTIRTNGLVRTGDAPGDVHEGYRVTAYGSARKIQKVPAAQAEKVPAAQARTAIAKYLLARSELDKFKATSHAGVEGENP